MIWIFLNNLAWIIGLLLYFKLQPEDIGYSALEQTLKTLSTFVPQVIRETRTGIYTNLYPRDTNGIPVVRPDTPNVRPNGQAPDPAENDDLIPAWETQEAYFGFPDLTQLPEDKWTSPTLPTE